MKYLVEKLVKSLEGERNTLGNESFSVRTSTPLKLNLNISDAKFKAIKEGDKIKKVAFIDGGNAEIIGSSSFSLSLVRRSAVLYEGSTKKKNLTSEFKCLSLLNKGDVSIYTDPKNSFSDGFKLKVPSQTIIGENGLELRGSQIISGKIRRFFEIDLALVLAEDNFSDVIVLDGSLDAVDSTEETMLNKLKKICELKNIILVGVSKTNNLLTNSGKPLSYVLKVKNTKKGNWYYDAYKSSSGNNVYFVKLGNQNSQKFSRIFKIDVASTKNIDELMEILNYYSKDSVFRGYPYGLIEADQNARISNQEISELSSEVMARSGSNWEIIEQALMAVDAHSVLDKIEF